MIDTIQPTAIPELNSLLHEFVTSVQAILRDNLLAIYLQGSFAVGDWDADSDADFLVATEHDISKSDLPALQAMHGKLYDLDTRWAHHLEGSYFPKEVLRRADPARTELLFLDNTHRELIRSNHCNTVVVRWVVRECGITLLGSEPKLLIDSVSADNLRQEIQATMQEWADEILDSRYRLDNRWVQPYVVIMYCRMLHSLHTGRIDSKLAGVKWATSALDPQWVDLIQRAWNERPNPSLKVRQPANSDDMIRTQEFIRYALTVSRKEISQG